MIDGSASPALFWGKFRARELLKEQSFDAALRTATIYDTNKAAWVAWFRPSCLVSRYLNEIFAALVKSAFALRCRIRAGELALGVAPFATIKTQGVLIGPSSPCLFTVNAQRAMLYSTVYTY